MEATVKLWDIESGTCIDTLTGHCRPVTSVAFSPKEMRIASGSYDMTVRLHSIPLIDRRRSRKKKIRSLLNKGRTRPRRKITCDTSQICLVSRAQQQELGIQGSERSSDQSRDGHLYWPPVKKVQQTRPHTFNNNIMHHLQFLL